ncbi:hypothetical protein [Arthrobacter dokdonensis]|uniref:hypothetical protein n=1 Tax=Arthrobacter dokdonellae TaxID=2211210 RepID=UPI001013C4A9|nr:hypothetical protein [Arthrobacter dokdonellae]
MPLVAAPAIYVVATLGIWWIHQGLENQSLRPWWSLLAIVLLLLALVGPLAALVYAAVGGFRAFRHWRRAQGHSTKMDAGVAQRESSSARAWEQARSLQSSLLRREVPGTIHIWDVVPNANEVFFMDVPADYARHYGMDVTYSQSSGFYFGRPAFVLAGLGINAISNAARRNAAANQAAAQWRERQPCRLVVSNQRLLCQVGGRWLSFYFSAVSAVYPEIEDWSLITQYDSAHPLLLSGVHVPAAALFTVLATHGSESVGAHPSLQKLRSSNVVGRA